MQKKAEPIIDIDFAEKLKIHQHNLNMCLGAYISKKQSDAADLNALAVNAPMLIDVIEFYGEDRLLHTVYVYRYI